MRRDFLKLSAAVGLGLAAPCRWPASSVAGDREELPPYAGPCYLVLNASGGWDTTMLMDPKGVGGINRLYTADQIQQQGQHRFAPTERYRQGGLSNEAFYAEFGHELLVVNGLDYSVNNHSQFAAVMAGRELATSPQGCLSPSNCRRSERPADSQAPDTLPPELQRLDRPDCPASLSPCSGNMASDY